MGSGTFDTSAYSARASVRSHSHNAGFHYDSAVKSGAARSVHPTLDLTRKPYREARDNADNPESLPIAILLDVTGSMRDVPKLLLPEFGKLMSIILDEGAVKYPQIAFGAIGDANGDRYPVQLSEFEADDELVEQHLGNLILEGGGGGTMQESYELLVYFFANAVETDAWEKRGQKSFLFIVGDEQFYTTVRADQAKRYLGLDLREDVDAASAFRGLQEKWEVFLLRPEEGSYSEEPYKSQVESQWKAVLPEERVIAAESYTDIVPKIAATISLMAGLDLATVVGAVRDRFGAAAADGVSTSLVPVASAVVPVAGELPVAADASSAPGAVRL
jgi:hypothetical protein